MFLSSLGLELIIQMEIELEQTFTSQDLSFQVLKSLNYQDWMGKFSHLPQNLSK